MDKEIDLLFLRRIGFVHDAELLDCEVYTRFGTSNSVTAEYNSRFWQFSISDGDTAAALPEGARPKTQRQLLALFEAIGEPIEVQ